MDYIMWGISLKALMLTIDNFPTFKNSKGEEFGGVDLEELLEM